jgi:DnaJ-class molecular chaperone
LELAKILHPDKNPDKNPDDINQKFIKVKESYKILSSKIERQQYDKKLGVPKRYQSR